MNQPVEVTALNRMGFGPRAGDLQRVAKMGLPAYVDEQLRPNDAADALFLEKIKGIHLHIEYDAGKDDKGKQTYPACKEDRPLRTLDQPFGELWKLTDGSPRADEERNRPLQEVVAAMWVRAVYSRWQLREVLVDFWHNHFNVNAGGDDSRIASTWPAYDRDVIRKNCLGNFRHFLEDVAKSLPMLSYLNNASSKASPANENFARELFELHTLGRDAYLNHLYNRWREVPGAIEGKPTGYIDQDVYEAARSFTGWTIADGTDSGRGDTFPNTGQFHYYDGWHDNYQKRVLGAEFDPNRPPMADGRAVLDMLAAHPATARHVCMKLCRRLVADEPPKEILESAIAAFIAGRDQPDQIAQTVRVILLHPQFAATWGGRVKRPFDCIVSFLRATGAEVRPTDGLFYLADRMGQHLFNWPAPPGHPEMSSYWLGANAMLGRWNAPLALLGDQATATFHLLRGTPESLTTWRQLCEFWVNRILGQPMEEGAFAVLLKHAAQSDKPDDAIGVGDSELVDRINGIVALIAMTPQFQLC